MKPTKDDSKCRLCLCIGSTIPIYPSSLAEQGDLENIDEKIGFISRIKVNKIKYHSLH